MELVSMPASMEDRRREIKPLVPSGPEGARTTEPRRTTFRSAGGVNGVVVPPPPAVAKKSGLSSCEEGRRATAPFLARSLLFPFPPVVAPSRPPAESLMALILSESESRGVLEPSAELKLDIDRSLTDTSGVLDCCCSA